MKKKFMTTPAEECRKDVLNVDGRLRATPGLVYPARATTRAKLERIYRYVFTAIARFKKLPAFSPVEVWAQGHTKKGPWAEFGPPAEKSISSAGPEAAGEPDGGEKAPKGGGLPGKDR